MRLRGAGLRACLATAMAWTCIGAVPAYAVDVVLGIAGDPRLRARIEGSSLLVQGEEADILPTGQDVVAAALADYTRIVGRLYSEGYFGPTVSILLDGREASEIGPLEVPAQVGRALLVVDAGPRFEFGRAAIAPLAPGSEITDDFAVGETATTKIVRRAAEDAVEGWRDIGYAKAEVADQDIVAAHPTETLRVSLAIRPGPVVRFGNASVRGNERVRTDAILRIAGLPRGTVFDPDEIELAQARLRRTGAFTSVVIEEAEDLRAGDVLDLGIVVVEEEPRRFGFGFEISSSEGASLETYWIHRNLFGGAERLRFDLAIDGLEEEDGGIDGRIAARYEVPAIRGADTTFFGQVEIEQRDEPAFQTRGAKIDLGYLRFVNERTFLRYGVQALYEEIDDSLGRRIVTQLALPLEGTYDARDDRLDPTEGYYVRAEIKPFVGLDGSALGARLFSDARIYRGFGEEDRTVLAGRVQAGTVVGAELEDISPNDLFFSGGAGTVRGQPFQSLGVNLDDGELRAGRSFLGLSGEVRRALSDRVGAVAFLDFGAVEDGTFVSGEADYHAGAGLGVRYATPLGPIRLDVAAPVAGDTGNGLQLYLGIGQAF